MLYLMHIVGLTIKCKGILLFISLCCFNKRVKMYKKIRRKPKVSNLLIGFQIILILQQNLFSVIMQSVICAFVGLIAASKLSHSYISYAIAACI